MDCFLRNAELRHREKAIDAIAWELLEAMDLKDSAYEPLRNPPYGALGRVEIARAMSIKPSLPLLDEPATA